MEPLAAWRRLGASAAGRWLFARLVCRRAPYFATIRPRFVTVREGLCVVAMPHRHRVTNHIGTVHAIAVANLCELAAGVMMQVTLPAALRWLPRGMTIEYLARAQGTLSATARLDRRHWAGAEDVGVPVTVLDAAGAEVVRAVITMAVRPRR